jgi:hypothetical protein
MATSDRVCPFCGEAPGPGVFCEACGRNLAAVERLPTREEWAGGGADATAAFLAAMRAAGLPGTTKLQMPDGPRQGLFRRTPEAEGWVVRPVVWDDRDNPKHHEPGLFLTTDGTFHRIDSQIRGWGQRDFPQFHDTASAAVLDPPADERLIADLEALLRHHGAAAGSG